MVFNPPRTRPIWDASMLSWLVSVARAHPGTETALTDDAWERLVDLALQGPIGCFEADVTVSWEHSSGGFLTRGRAQSTWRFDHHIWRLDRWELSEGDERSLPVRVTPQLLGSAIHTEQVYPTTRHRLFRWPSPIATLPTRLFGEIQSVALDELADGSHRVREAFEWDGWKDVEGEISVLVVAGGVPAEVALDATDRWPDGCRVRSVGTATLGARGLPSSESWTLQGRCPLKDWDGTWSFAFGDWHRCAFSGPSPTLVE
jgi:hypothetical protein